MNLLNIKTILLLVIIFSLISCSSGENRKVNTAPQKSAVKAVFPEVRVSHIKAVQNEKPSKVKTSLKLPATFTPRRAEKIFWSNGDVKLRLFARKFAQGNAVYVEILGEEGKSRVEVISLFYDKKRVPVSQFSWGYRGFWGINPMAVPGSKKIVIRYTVSGKEKSAVTYVNVRDKWFPVAKRRLNLGKFSNRDYYKKPKFKKLIAECSKMKRRAFATVHPDYITNELSHPRDMHKITGMFWKKRTYLSYQKRKGKVVSKKGRVRYHRGLDLKGKIGAPVFSMAEGVVVMAYKMFFEGNMVIVNHGSGIFSYYMHMNRLNVRAGDRVHAGDEIGTVGSTGMSTASHLHVSLVMRGVHVDPLSILSLPVSR